MIHGNQRKFVVSLVLAAILPACSTMESIRNGVTVPINTSSSGAEKAKSGGHAIVKVYDIRKQAVMERKNPIGNLSLGKITLTPPVPELVKSVVQEKADAVLARREVQAPVIVSCGIREFDVTTPGTLLYFDVVTKIELVLRVSEQEKIVSSIATERTYIWPSEEMIQRVTEEALAKIGSETERALAELVPAAP